MKPDPVEITLSGRVNNYPPHDLATITVPLRVDTTGPVIDRAELRRRLYAAAYHIVTELAEDHLP